MMAPSSTIKASKSSSAQLMTAYVLFALSAGGVWHLVADGAFSSILTFSVMLQCLALVLLGLQMSSTNSASGISAQTLLLDGIAICCRLSSTLWLNGYLPVDASGDYFFQFVDICSLCIVGGLLYNVLVAKRHTYEAENDSLPVAPMVFGAVVLAAMLHGNMNSRPVFDTLWMAGLFVSTIAVLPQLWLITRAGGSVDALTSHHIVAMAASRVLSGIFMWKARHDITCIPWIGSFNHASWAILGAHFLHMVLLGDFAYYYVKAVLANGLNCRIEIAEGCGV